MPKQSKDNDIFNDEPSGKKLKVFKCASPLYTNHVFSIVLKFLTSLRSKTKASQTTHCSYDKVSFELILNEYFLNLLNVKEKTVSWPQSLHNINAFFTKVFFYQIFQKYMLNYQCDFVLQFFA